MKSERVMHGIISLSADVWIVLGLKEVVAGIFILFLQTIKNQIKLFYSAPKSWPESWPT